jgi:hypothetical protein
MFHQPNKWRNAIMATTSKTKQGNGGTTAEEQKIAGLPKLEALPKDSAPAAPLLVIQRIQTEEILVPVVGTSPLIMHNWSEKARRIMLETQQGRKAPKENRDPEADYQAAFYRIATDEGETPRFGMPVVAFKQCTVSAARFYGKNVTMTALQQCLFFRGVMTPADRQELSEVHGEPHMREDMVGVGDWRPEKRGTFGTFTIDESRNMTVVGQ